MKNNAITRRATLTLALAGAAGMVNSPGQARAEGDEVSRSRAVSAPSLRDLKTVGPEGQVMTVRHVGNAFEITTADGRLAVVSEINLRFKVDSSRRGPLAGRPVILAGGMMGDRATMFFASAVEIADLIGPQG